MPVPKSLRLAMFRAAFRTDPIALSRTLIPRTFLRNLLASRIAVSTLNQIKYVDAKVNKLFLRRMYLTGIDFGLGAGVCL